MKFISLFFIYAQNQNAHLLFNKDKCRYTLNLYQKSLNYLFKKINILNTELEQKLKNEFLNIKKTSVGNFKFYYLLVLIYSEKFRVDLFIY